MSAIVLRWQNFEVNIPPGNSSASIPSRFYALRHNQYHENCRIKPTHLCNTGKSIHDTRKVYAIQAHRPVLCYTGKCMNCII